MRQILPCYDPGGIESVVFFSRTPLRTPPEVRNGVRMEYVMNEKVEYVIRRVEYVIN